MPDEPLVKRAVAFVDGQNLYHAARQAFGCTYPNYDVHTLASAICQSQTWTLAEVRFYTGVPDPADNAVWHAFWVAKLAQMGRQGVRVFSRSLRYRNKRVLLPDGSEHTYLAGEEKLIEDWLPAAAIGVECVRVMIGRAMCGSCRTCWRR